MSTSTSKKSVFETLVAINCNEHTEQKNGLTYLSWAWAWAEVKKRFPDASYEIFKDDKGRVFVEDIDLGFMCHTSVTIAGETQEMWLPVMDGANKAMKRVSYTYKVWNKYKNQYDEKEVSAATMFDINKTIMRCLVKNLAMFGLGLYIYAGEDLPEADIQDLTEAVLKAENMEQLQTIWNNADTATREKMKGVFSSRRKELGV